MEPAVSTNTNFKLEKKDMIHIGIEVLTFIGLVYYFSSQNKKLKNYIEELAQRLEEKEVAITKLQENQKQLSLQLNQLSQYSSSGMSNILEKMQELSQGKKERKIQAKRPIVEELKPVSKPIIIPKEKVKPEQKMSAKVSFIPKVESKAENKEESDSESDSEEDSDLDNEISQELKELESGNKNENKN